MRSDLQIAAHLAALNEPRYRYFTEDGVRYREDRDTGQTRRADTQDWDRRDGDQDSLA